jgi:4'-phosphopantetheinyl transferase
LSEVVVHWSLCRAEERLFLQLGEAPEFLLDPREREILAGLKVPKRRKEWLLGRFAAKRLCCSWLAGRGRQTEPGEIAVLPSEDGAPRVELSGQGPLEVTLTISHRAGAALCALVEGQRAPLGADLELSEPRPALFAEDFFTDAEARALPADGEERWRAMAEIWSLKESALKALRVGLRADTRTVEVGPRSAPVNGWGSASLALRLPAAPPRGRGLVRWEGDLVSTVAWLGDASIVLRPAADQSDRTVVG